MIAPTLIKGAVTLRPHLAADFEAFWTFYQSPRAAFVSKPQNRTPAWYGFRAEVASWTLYGMGAWAIDVDGTLAGQISVCQPPHFPEIEIGWILLDGYEGRSIAYDAACLALDYTWSHIQPATLVSYIDQSNARSITLAERLGAAPDPQAEKWDAVDIVYRHTRPQ